MARRFKRTYARVPVDLVSIGGPDGFSQIGSICDMSQGGLRVQTSLQLIPGRRLHVFLEGSTRPFAWCRVVWARSHGDSLPSEAGLEILEQMPSCLVRAIRRVRWHLPERYGETA